MGTPFPGMDPYLEYPAVWPDVHTRLITAIGDILALRVAPHYYVALEQRAYLLTPDNVVLVGMPDIAIATQTTPVVETVAPASNGVIDVEVPMTDEVYDRYLEIHEAKTGALITIIELLSPANKLHNEGRRQYEEKRGQILASRTSLVEIDLLRAGSPMAVYSSPIQSDYRILVSRGWQRPRAQLYTFSLRSPIPQIPIPLQRGEMEPLLDLNTVLHDVYSRARYDLRLDYTRPPVPPLPPEDAAWAATLLPPTG